MDFERVAVIGAGTMGHGLAQLFAVHGHTVTLVARHEATLDRAREQIRKNLGALARRGLVPEDRIPGVTARLRASTRLREAVAHADLVIEAVPEQPEVKAGVYDAVGAACPPAAVVASTTSGLNIFAIAPEFPEPARLAIAHFWNPPYLVPLVEVVPGPLTALEVLVRLEVWLVRLGRAPVRLRGYIEGFIGVRLAAALYREALHLIQEGVTDAAGIDTVMRESVGLRFPILDPLEVVDFGGLDTFAAVWASVFPGLSAAPAPPAIVQDWVRQGRVGLKAGRGFYDYTGQLREALLEQRDAKLVQWLADRHRYRLDRKSRS
jgi:3-hydroxybutyryl-CoA dehydrogenase